MVAEGEEEVPAAANAVLLFVSLAGAALLVWWAAVFHRCNEQLWMVPLGLIMMGTPVVVWFAVFASDAWRSLELLLFEDLPVETPVEPDPEK